MATKLYTNDIDKTIDWGGDTTTGGLPVSGEKVQKFIKDTLVKKFGYLYFDKDNLPGHDATNQYIIFADEEDFNAWFENPNENKALELGSFDAPAPATIYTRVNGSMSNTILISEADNQEISIDYYILKSDNTYGSGEISYDISIRNGANVIKLPKIKPEDLVKYNLDQTDPFNKQDNSKDDPSRLVFGKNSDISSLTNLGQYLQKGNNIITIILTSELFNVSTTLTFQYNVIDFVLTSTFDYQKGIPVDDASVKSLLIPIHVEGQGQKYIRVFIDGQNVLGSENESKYIGSDSSIDFIYGSDTTHGMRFENATWAKEGKHTLQFYCFIQNGATEIKSKTLYYDFVLTKRGMINKTYILFKRENDSGELITETELSIASEQYNEMVLSFIAYNTSDRLQGSNIKLDFIITKEGETEPIVTKGITVGNGTWDEEKNNFKYTFQDWGNMTLEIKPNNDDVSDSSFAHIDVRESSAKVSEATNGLIMKLVAMNRSNGESEDIRNDWHYDYYQINSEDPTVFKATFNNVLFNKQSGWQDNCLVLNNASVSFNISPFQYFNANNGLTIEIDFETANVQDDNAPIMRYGSESGAHIFINACNTEMKSNNGSTITTHYKDNSRQKIQFIYAGNVKNQQDITKSACVSSCDLPFLYYMVVNGILDRVVKFDDSISTADTSMTIGNLDGKVTVKLHSVKVYNRALTLDECVDNYILDSSDILTNYNKNNVYSEGSKELSINKILENNIPVMRIYGDVQQSIVKLFNKKSNVPVDVLYEDRNNPEMNFFAADCWMSNQGTSSMNYPRRNLRLYFNKTSDDNTVRGYGTTEQYLYHTRVFPGLIDQNAITEIQNDINHETFEKNGIRALCNKKWQVWNDSKNTYEALKDSVNSTKGAQYELLKNLMCPVDELKAKRMWHSNIKLYLEKSSVNETTGETVYEFKKVKNFNKDCYGDDKKFKVDKVFVYGGYTHFKEKDLYTDRWTLKCDYAESSMTHNAGVGRLWGDVMANTEISTGGFRPQFDPESKTISDVPTNFPCRTFTQEVTKAYTKKNGVEYGDIRTSCDGYPIVIINYPRKRNENGEVVIGQWESPIFLGLYNIMTDKGSTPLFGFEDLKDDDGSLLYDAGNRNETKDAEEAYKEEIEKENKDIQIQRTECWECLQNGSALAQMYDMKTDTQYVDDLTADTNEDRYIWRTYEARWPDNDNTELTLTNRLESVIRFVNFCKDAVNVTVAGRDGYTMSDYSEIEYSDGIFIKSVIRLQELVDNPTKLRDIIAAENSDIIANNSWDGKLYVEKYGKSPKDRTSKFYQTENGAYVTNADGSYKFWDATTPDGKTAILKQIKKIEEGGDVVHKISYSSGQGAAASSISAMQPIYNIDASDDEKVAAVAEVMNSDTPTLYEMEIDMSDTSIEEIDPILIDVTNADYKFYYYDSAFDRSDIHKSISNKKITNEIYTGLVYTFDGKRKNLDGDSLHPEAWTRVYLEKATTGNRYNYIDECGNQALYNGEPEEEKCSGYYGTKGASFVGKTYMDYFKDKKYEHFDVWKLAAYYVYIMRFAAVDQVVKNTMMTTEDGQHYYFINYDNDTILGVRNDGYLVFDWQIDRNSYDSTGNSYAYAGFGSVLWNLLEQDDDFMNKVKTVATAMVTSGVLTYDIALDMFNNKQCGTWSERLYNNSEMYKYIGIFKDIDNEGNPKKYDPFTNTRYLPFLQGSRKSHREWWLRHRFDLFDSKWGAGEYSTFYTQIYWNGVAASAQLPKPIIRLKSGSKFYYTFNADNQNLDSQIVNGEPDHENEVLANVGFVELGAEESCLVKTKMSLAIGNPIRVLGVHKATEIDLSPAKEQLTSAIEFSPSLQGMELKVLNIGGENTNSCGIEGIINLHKCTALEKLNIRGCNNRNFTLLDISTLYNLNTYLAANTNLTTFEPAVNSIMDKVELGSMVKTLVLDKISFTQDDSFIYTPTKILTSATLNNCTINGKDLDIVKFLLDWNTAIDNDPDTKAQKRSYKCSLAFNEIEVTKEELRKISKMKKEFGLDINGNPNFVITSGIIKLKGQLDRELYDELTTGIQTAFYEDGTTRVWGDSFFTSQSAARFDAEQESIFVEAEVNGVKVADISKISIVAGQEVSMKAIIFPMSSDRTIEFIPYYVNKQGNSVAWSKNTSGQYYRNYHGTITQTRYNSYLTNEYGFATLSTHEYDVFDTINNAVNNGDFIDIRIPLMVKDENSDNTEQKSILTVTMERTKKPAAPDIYMYKGSNQIEMDVVNDATLPIEYIIKYRSYDAFNIDILNVESYMTATECGSLTSEIKLDDDNNQYISVIYAPKIKQVDTDFAIVVDVTLNDADNTVLNKQLNISLKTKAISSNSLVMKYGDDALESYSDTEGVKTFKFVKYFKNITKTREDLPITLELTDYNVNIKKMTLGTTILEDATIATTVDKNTNRIETITFKIENLSKSLINSGILNIQLTDEFDQQINWRLDFYIATFYADGVDIIKYEKRNNILYQLDTLDIDLLLNETDTQFIYKANVYSLIGSVKYYFISETDTSEFISNFENTVTLDKTVFGTEETFVSALKYNIGVHSDPTNTTTFEPITLLEAVTSTNPFMKVFNIKSGIETGIIKDCHISVNISNKEYITDNKVKFFTVSKDGCSAKDGNWNNLAPGFYIVDMNKRFYYMDVNTGNNNAWSRANIIHKDIDGTLNPFCVTYIYEDINSIKRSISLDPKLLLENKKYYWWKEYSTYVQNTNIIPLLDNQRPTLFSKLNGTTYNSLGELFEQYVKYYALVCYNSNNSEDKVRLILNTNPSTVTIESLAQDIHDGTIKIDDITFSDSDMIFSKCYYYKKKANMPYVCRPLSVEEIQTLLYDANRRTELEFALDYVGMSLDDFVQESESDENWISKIMDESIYTVTVGNGTKYLTTATEPNRDTGEVNATIDLRCIWTFNFLNTVASNQWQMDGFKEFKRCPYIAQLNYNTSTNECNIPYSGINQLAGRCYWSYGKIPVIWGPDLSYSI